MTHQYNSIHDCLIAYLAVTSGVLLLLGCGDRDPIRTYEVPPISSIAPSKAEASVVPQRTLAAAFLQSDQVWFFKLMGPEADVSRHQEEFRSLIESVRYADGKPTWTLPVGWIQRPGANMRFATLSPPPPSPLEATVIALPAASYQELDNVNRWRSQLGLAPWSQEQLNTNITRIDVNGISVVWIDIVGQAEAGNAMKSVPLAGPTSSSLTPAIAPPTTPENHATDPPTNTKPLASDVPGNLPEHWKPGQMSAMRKAAYTITDGDEKAEITVIVLGAQSGSIEDNVNRWRGQLGLPPLDAAVIDQSLKSITVDGSEGSYVEIFADKSASGSPPAAAQAMLAAFVKSETQTVYFKLMGSAELAKRERDNFKRFAEQFKIQ